MTFLYMPVTAEETAKFDDQDPVWVALQNHGITAEYLAEKLKAELEAKVTKTQKVTGIVKKEELPEGVSIKGQAYTIRQTTDSDTQIVTADTVLAWDEENWPTRQKARMDAHNLLGHYPDKSMQLKGNLGDTELNITVRGIDPKD